ncbi:hypothetical protein EZV73_22940 [Acidaminobacter sp. JC074]|uniref:TadE/TadG family type IV pilus assembly protein n=1 Tax=Acidaminobacter sp. JC074 TaxID=2530199 RepID=UPI001F10B1B2|nr:TadE/TadG family type IV pilus assembly protein [Acidaminobacter sp. JC074]MCH4890455.1 hypothetical protein [Acidaminobacter sp. JC074]
MNTFRKQDGSILVIVVFVMIILLGVMALVIDIGRVVVEKQKLQVAIDATLLAAAPELPDTTKAKNVANQYIVLNGYTSDDISVTFEENDSIIRIVGQRNVDLVFAPIIGFDNQIVSTQGAAQSGGDFYEAFLYTIFSGSTEKELILNSEDIMIEGDAHTNEKLKLNGKRITIDGRAEAVKQIELDGESLSITEQVPNHHFIEMPDFSEEIKQQAKAAGTYYNGDVTFNSSDINLDSNIYVKGKVTINGNNFVGSGCIIATDEIIINGDSTHINSDDFICLYSKNKDIIVNEPGTVIDGILYAPNGKVKLNGENQTINGRLIGNEVEMNGKNQNVYGGGTEVLRSVTEITTKLIE